MRCQEILRIQKFPQKLHVFFFYPKGIWNLDIFQLSPFFSTGTPQIPAIFFRKADDVPTILIIHPVYPHSQTKQNFCIHWINRLGGWINRVRWMPPYFFQRLAQQKPSTRESHQDASRCRCASGFNLAEDARKSFGKLRKFLLRSNKNPRWVPW